MQNASETMHSVIRPLLLSVGEVTANQHYYGKE